MFKDAWMSLPNLLTVSRALLGFVIPFLVLSLDRFLHGAALVLFVLGTITDYWDGALARKWNLVSPFGKIMDPIADKILILGALSAFSGMAFFSPLWLVPIFFREIVITFCRIGWLLEGRAVGAETLGKYKFAAQVVAVLSCFFYLFTFDYSFLSVVVVLLKGFLWLSFLSALVLTLISGISFVKSNRVLFQTAQFARYTAALGVGLIPIAPGTWGSLVGLALVSLVHFNGWLYGLVFVALIAAGGWGVSRMDSKDEDPREVVVDEACGVMLSLAGIPFGWQTALLGFLLFRLFDVVKPFPVNRFEKIPGYGGILGDDLAAGVYTWLVLQIFF